MIYRIYFCCVHFKVLSHFICSLGNMTLAIYNLTIHVLNSSSFPLMQGWTNSSLWTGLGLQQTRYPSSLWPPLRTVATETPGTAGLWECRARVSMDTAPSSEGRACGWLRPGLCSGDTVSRSCGRAMIHYLHTPARGTWAADSSSALALAHVVTITRFQPQP